MNPASSFSFALSFTLFLIGGMLVATGLELPIFDADSDDGTLDPFFSGYSGNFSIESSDSEFIGISVYVIGTYQDSDSNGLWDLCESSEIIVWNTANEKPETFVHENNTFFPLCNPGFENNGSFNELPMISIGSICSEYSNPDSEICEDGTYTIESPIFMRLVLDTDQKTSFLKSLIDMFLSGIRNGYSLLCGSIFFFILGYVVSYFSNDEVELKTKKREKPIAEWRAYGLTQTERGRDGLPKAFSRHVQSKELFSKPRKGNVRGGVHKSGGLYLDGWTEADSDKEYKKKVEDRRGRRG